LHGAGGRAEYGIDLLRALADECGFLLLAPASQGETWDVIESSFGTDVAMLDSALHWVFDRYSVSRAAIGGFSDGASYALSLGLINGDLFSHVLAFSPGFMVIPATAGKPVIFISHGINDRVLPIGRCSRSLVPRLSKAGYTVIYEEFPGGHAVPEAFRRAAVELFLGRKAPQV
jgi:predicted esterase